MLNDDYFFKTTKSNTTCEYGTLLAQQVKLLNVSWRLCLTIEVENAFDWECAQLGHSLKLDIGSFQTPVNIWLACTVNYYTCDDSTYKPVEVKAVTTWRKRHPVFQGCLLKKRDTQDRRKGFNRRAAWIAWWQQGSRRHLHSSSGDIHVKSAINVYKCYTVRVSNQAPWRMWYKSSYAWNWI